MEMTLSLESIMTNWRWCLGHMPQIGGLSGSCLGIGGVQVYSVRLRRHTWL